MLRHLLGLGVALLLACAVFTLLERRWPALRGRSWWQRRGHRTDLAYVLLNPLVTQPVVKAATVAAVVLVAVALGTPLGDVPAGFLAQLAWPFRRRASATAFPAGSTRASTAAP